jgi:3-deoxy-D-manno-octulosonic-acid transferase
MKKKSLMYSTELTSGMYTKLSRKYYTKWKTRLFLEDLVFEHEFNLENSRVFIVFESSSLGDTIAWMPYCEEFRKKHNCHVIVSTFRNDMFEKFIS